MLEEKIMSDYKQAMKDKDSIKSTLLSSLRAQMMNAALAKKADKLDDNETLVVIKKLVKQHQDSIEQFTKGNRMDLVEKEQKELDILKSYLPAELSVDEIKAIVEEVVASTGASSIKDMGRVMKEAAAKAGAGADAKVLSGLVKSRLSGGLLSA